MTKVSTFLDARASHLKCYFNPACPLQLVHVSALNHLFRDISQRFRFQKVLFCSNRFFLVDFASTMKRLALVAACCRSHGIGKDGDLPWRLKSELEFFSRITSTVLHGQTNSGDDVVKKNAVIMGMRTYMAIPPRYRPLRNRVNVVLSRTASVAPAGVDHMFRSLPEAIEILSTLAEIDQLYIIGGEEVYRESLKSPQTEFVFLTRIDADFDCDRFIPPIDPDQFEDLTEEAEKHKALVTDRFNIPLGVQEENGLQYRYHLYRRKTV